MRRRYRTTDPNPNTNSLILTLNLNFPNFCTNATPCAAGNKHTTNYVEF